MIPSRGEPVGQLKAKAYNVIWRLKTGVKDLMTQAAVEGIILGVFDQFTREQLLEAITLDQDMWAVAWGDFEEFRPQLMSLMRDPVNAAVVSGFTLEDVVAWLRVGDARPDLASIIINTDGGVDWLRRQIDVFKQHLVGMTEVDESG